MINSLLRIAGVYKAYEKYLIEQIKYGPMPQHIGIILDGNRRWATEKALNSTDGHWAGAIVKQKLLLFGDSLTPSGRRRESLRRSRPPRLKAERSPIPAAAHSRSVHESA